MPSVAFDYGYFQLGYPALAAQVSAPLAADCFQEATLYLNNTDSSIVSSLGERAMLLRMLTAHIATLRLGAASGGLVGRIASASQGSVSVSADLSVPGTATWYAQTQYGLSYWQATSMYRRATYVAPMPSPLFGW